MVSDGECYEVKVSAEESTELFLGLEWESRIVESLSRYSINGVEGWGVVEWMYTNSSGRPPKSSRRWFTSSWNVLSLNMKPEVWKPCWNICQNSSLADPQIGFTFDRRGLIVQGVARKQKESTSPSSLYSHDRHAIRSTIITGAAVKRKTTSGIYRYPLIRNKLVIQFYIQYGFVSNKRYIWLVKALFYRF